MTYDKLNGAARAVVNTGRNFKSQLTRWTRTKGTNSNNSAALRNAANELYHAARYAAHLALERLQKEA